MLQYQEHLNATQLQLVEKAITHSENPHFHGLCFNLPMGSGKTRIALILGVNIYPQFIVVCKKTLIANWINEIQKLFGDLIKYEIVHRDYLRYNARYWRPHPQTRIIITTPEVISASYVDNNIKPEFLIEEDRDIFFNVPRRPLDTTGNVFHGTEWGGIFIDEAHTFTNCKTQTCQALSSLCRRHSWLLTGTILQEPKIERICGFFLLLNQTEIDSLKSCKKWIPSQDFVGLQRYCLTCPPPELNIQLFEHRVEYQMTRSENLCFLLFHDIIEKWMEYYQEQKARLPPRDPILAQIRGHMLALITYFRLSLLDPKVALTNLLNKIQQTPVLASLGTNLSYMNDLLTEQPDISTRRKKLYSIIDSHPDERIIVFGSFTSVFDSFILDRPTEKLTSQMSARQREDTLNRFRQSDNGVLFLTYQLGAEGLNLQEANVIIHLDLYWNAGRQEQALARSYRYGQTKPVHRYFIISDTGFERGLLTKQDEKLEIIDDINEGSVRSLRQSSLSFVEWVGGE